MFSLCKEVTGFPGIPSLETLEGCFVHSEVKSTGSLFTSCSLVNKIHENIRWGQLSNLMSIPTDCPQRDERMGWWETPSWFQKKLYIIFK